MSSEEKGPSGKIQTGLPSKVSLPSPKKSGGIPEFLQVLLIYGLSISIIAFYSNYLLSGAPRLPEGNDRVFFLLIAILPLALTALFLHKMTVLFLELRKKRYGSRLRLKLVGLFLLAMTMASLPQGLVLLRLVQAANSSTASERIRLGLSGGVELAMEYYAEDSRRLEYMARQDLPRLAPGRLPAEPDKLLDLLKDREPRTDALEVFREGKSVAFAGDIAARLTEVPLTAMAGPLSASTRDGVVRLRYLVPWQGKGGALVLSLRLPEDFGAKAAALSKAKTQADLMSSFSGEWARLVVLFYLVMVLPLLLIAALLGLAAADYLVEPLVMLEGATRKVASGDFALRLLVKPGDETGRFVASFNRMLSEIERYREGDLQRGKVDAWQDIAQRLAHELKNPLTPIRLTAERLLRTSRKDPARAQELTETSMLAIIAEVEGMDALLTDFRAFASLPEPMRDWADLRGIISESVALYRSSYPEVEFVFDNLPPELKLRVDKAQLKRALANLFINSIEAMERRGRIEIRADLVRTSNSRYCRLRISDTGPGIPGETLGKIFSPYFTTKSNGTGLGLAIVERIIVDHGGSVRCESTPGAGASFYIDLPLTP